VIVDDEARAELLRKLAAYRKFVAASPDHPAPVRRNDLDWLETLPAKVGGHGAIRVAGLSSVWISDDDDGNRESPFIPNMVLARGPLAATMSTTGADELVFTLSHHPEAWIHKQALPLLEQALARHPHVHLCGHVHDAKAGVAKRFGRAGRAVRYVAGAAHGDASEAAKHGYAWGAIRFDAASGAWQAGWAPRVYVQGHDAMRADATLHTLDAGGFAWEDIGCPWPAPAG